MRECIGNQVAFDPQDSRAEQRVVRFGTPHSINWIVAQPTLSVSITCVLDSNSGNDKSLSQGHNLSLSYSHLTLPGRKGERGNPNCMEEVSVVEL